MIFVALDNIHQSLICLLSRRKVIFGIGKGVVEVEIITLDCDSFELWIASLNWTKPFIVKHCLRKSEITSVEDGAHFSFKEEHNCAWTMKGIHKYYLNTFLLILIQVNPMLLVHLEIDDKVFKTGKPINNEFL